MSTKIYDFIGIGIGPFNLGLAALSSSVKDLDCLFLDQQEEFQWHPGMLINNTTLQVPFLADLVTMADPTNRFSFLNYLKENNRIYQFYIRENFFLLRNEYNEYCRWAVSNLPSCLFSHRVERIAYAEGIYILYVTDLKRGDIKTFRSRRLVLGTGTSPFLPEIASGIQSDRVFHTSSYLKNKSKTQKSRSISIIGSGQSAAEIFYDLLTDQENHGYSLNWYTRSDRFFPMEYSKLTLELTSPDFLDHFYHLPQQKKDQLVPKQKSLYKGINYSLINDIYDELYRQSLNRNKPDVKLHPGVTLTGLKDTGNAFVVDFNHPVQEVNFQEQSEVVILATGYCYKEPAFLEGIKDRIRRDEKNRYIVSRGFAIDHYERGIFVQNAELHTHGFVTPDLGMAGLHNATILNQILGKEHFVLEKKIAFQTFGAPVKEPAETNLMLDEAVC